LQVGDFLEVSLAQCVGTADGGQKFQGLTVRVDVYLFPFVDLWLHG
jgi:hypothetical protein